MPTLVVRDVNHVIEFFAADAVGNILHIGQGIDDASLLGTDHKPVEIGIHHVGT